MEDIQSKENQENWKAWVEIKKGRLHVHGQISVKDESLFYQLEKKEPQGYLHEELLLEVKPDIAPGNTKVEIKYHEDVQNENEYTRIKVMANNEELKQINEIGKAD